MQTDIPLKRLTALCGADLVELLGLPAATLLSVETFELPASKQRLDAVLRIRSPGGQIYFHVLEWQGYADSAILWRLAYAIIWTGREYPDFPVVGTVVYLTPASDMGDTLTQVIDGTVVQQWQMQAVRVWERDAAAAVASGKPGLAVLSPLMAHATAALVEQTVNLVLTATPLSQQNELLTILGILAERLITAERFQYLVGKERLMESKLLDYLMQEKTKELKTQFAAREAALEAQLQLQVEREARHRAEAEARLQMEREAHQRAEAEARLQMEREAHQRAETEARFQAEREAHQRAEAEARFLVEREAHQRAEAEARLLAVVTQLQQALQETLVARFPHIPPTLVLAVQRVMDPMVLSQLTVAAVQADDVTAFARTLEQAGAQR